MKTRRRFLGALVASAMAIGLLPARAVLGADPETYNVWIGGKQVTSENMDDVLGSGSGSVKYDPATSTLTLDEPSFSKSTHESGAQIYAEGVNLTIRGTAGICTSAVEYNVYIYVFNTFCHLCKHQRIVYASMAGLLCKKRYKMQ